MKAIITSTIVLILALASAWAEPVREVSGRLRTFDKNDPSSFQLTPYLPGYVQFFRAIIDDPFLTPSEIEKEKEDFDIEVDNFLDSFIEGSMSMQTSDPPSDVPSKTPTFAPSSMPSSRPTNLRASASPTILVGDTEGSSSPSSDGFLPFPNPTASPSISVAPSETPTNQPSLRPSSSPSVPETSEPSASPSEMPSGEPTDAPTDVPSAAPSLSVMPSSDPSAAPSLSRQPSATPTIFECGISAATRAERILQILYNHSSQELIDDINTPQGRATNWLINDDGLRLCPDEEKIIQRWVLAVIYFSTNGEFWFRCSSNPFAQDACGFEEPFPGKQRFLSSTPECEWAGISCINGCVTEIEFEENNLVGTIPEEIGYLSDLAIWGMERGGLSSSIPTTIAKLTNLIFLDLDFNALTGSLSSELLSLTSLTQLDINNNQMTGSINGIGVFPDMEFLQLHDNFFTGTVPSAVGTFRNLAAFTLHETAISGTMPQSVCALLASNTTGGGVLTSLIADCRQPAPDIICSCCTDCRRNP